MLYAITVRDIIEVLAQRINQYSLVVGLLGLGLSIPLHASAQTPEISPAPADPATTAGPQTSTAAPGTAPAAASAPVAAGSTPAAGTTLPASAAPAPNTASPATAPPPATGQYPQPYPPTTLPPDYDRDFRRRQELVMDYTDGQPVPPGYTVMERSRKGLTITGSILLGVSYGISLSVAAGSEYDDTYGWLAIPVAGPLIASAQLEDCDADGSCGDNGAERGFLMLDALAQGAGAAMLIIGLAVPKKVLVRNLAIDLTVRPALVAGGAQGVELAGTF